VRILYLDTDTLRADHLGCYGYHRNTTPNIDRVAREGIRFDNCYCSDAPCLPSRTALMTGKFGIHSGVVDHGGICADLRLQGPGRSFASALSRHALPALLKRQGLHTVFIGGFGERHSSWSFYAGFREIHDTGLRGMESAENVTPSVLDWIERNAKKDNWYLHVNYWDPHTPYRAPADFGDPFRGDPMPEWFNEDLLREHRSLPGPHTAQDLSMYSGTSSPEYPRYPGELKDMDDLARFINGYDCGIAYMDRHIGRLLEGLEAKGVYDDDLAIIVSADHGENMGELGIYGEHATADQITCRIPLVIRWPGGRKGTVNAGLRYNLDLAPTLAELFGVPPEPEWDGQSYAPGILEGTECGRDHVVISQCAHVCQRGVRWKDWMYIHTRHDGFHLFPEEMLFDIRNDRHEQNDLARSSPEVCGEARDILHRWHKEMMDSMPGQHVDPMETVLEQGGPFHARGCLRDYCERLDATGRGDSVAELKKRHPREFE
jgi:choline-sulfatase